MVDGWRPCDLIEMNRNKNGKECAKTGAVVPSGL